MNEKARLRLQLQADPSELSEFDSEAALEAAQSLLREWRADVEVTHVELLSPTAVGVVLLSRPVSVEDIDDIATALRSALGIGPGIDRLVAGRVGGVRGIGGEVRRGIGGEERTCPRCGIGGGRHLRRCPLFGAG